MRTTEQIMDDLTPMVSVLAKRYGARCSQQGANHEDFAQEMWAWVFSHTGKVSHWLDEDEDGRIYTALENECRDYAVDIRAQAGGQDRQTAYWYTTGELEVLLESVWDRDKWTQPPQHDGDGSRSPHAPAEGGNWIATLADVSRALDKLSADDRELLKESASGIPQHQLAELYGVADSTISYRYQRALARLLEVLGGPRPAHMKQSVIDPVWRGRHAVGNRQAIAIQQSYYDEG